MSYWIVKGNPRRNNLDEMLSPGVIEPWVTKKPPRDWAKGDRVFFWKSTPSLCLVGLGEINRIVLLPEEDGNTRFYLTYLSKSLGQNGLSLESLRQEPLLESASFLKAGAAGTVYPVTETQAQRLGLLLGHKDASFHSILSTWFGPSKSTRTPAKSQSEAQVLDNVSGTWSRSLAITSLMRMLGLELPKTRLSWKQFATLVDALQSRNLEMALSDSQNVLSKEDLTPGIEVNVRIRKKSSASISTPLVQPPPFPEELLGLHFDNEPAVELQFVKPLLQHLGFTAKDYAIRHPVEMNQGTKKFTKKTDITVFEGNQRGRHDALLVVEAKSPSKTLTDNHEKQALSYAIHLKSTYCILTNGIETKVYEGMNLCLRVKTVDLPQRWSEFYQKLNRNSVIEAKKKWREHMETI